MNESEYSMPNAPAPVEDMPEVIGGDMVVAAESSAEPSAWGSVRSFLRETLETIALTLIIFVVIRAGVQNFRIEGFSMEPNFHDGQYLLISKVDYLLHTPERGDVVVFTSPQNRDRDFIKRVIGLPGETVDIHEGKVFIDGKELPQTYNVNPGSYNFGPAMVGSDQLFVLGDNRNNSSDSHSWGMLPRTDVIGKAWVSYWPPQLWAVIQSPSFAQSDAVRASPPTAAPAKPTISAPYPSY